MKKLILLSMLAGMFSITSAQNKPNEYVAVETMAKHLESVLQRLNQVIKKHEAGSDVFISGGVISDIGLALAVFSVTVGLSDNAVLLKEETDLVDTMPDLRNASKLDNMHWLYKARDITKKIHARLETHRRELSRCPMDKVTLPMTKFAQLVKSHPVPAAIVMWTGVIGGAIKMVVDHKRKQVEIIA